MKPTLLFVHGTGVRQASFAVTLRLVTHKAALHLPGWRVEGCQWGDAFGAQLNMKGASVPGYQASGNAAPALEAADRARWVLLVGDPLIELRTAPDDPVIGAKPGPRLWEALLLLRQPPRALQDALESVAAADVWPALLDDVAASPDWQDLVQRLTLKGPAVNEKIARALVAALQARLRTEGLPGPTHTGRSRLVAAFTAALGGALGLRDWFARAVTAVLRPRRGRVTDGAGPLVGDILRYQARGQSLRAFISEEVKRTDAQAIVAHSLGGIAAVDWFAEAQRSVPALVTVGSQAAYLYEIDALASRPWGSGLPEHFPRRWLNIYDERDFLSNPAAAVFPGIATDVLADNGQPFPDAHSAYWHNDEQVWQPIAKFLPP